MPKTPVASALVGLMLASCAFAESDLCTHLSTQAEHEQALLNPPASYRVGGTGRLYFHTAPADACRTNDIFVIPNDELIAYSDYAGWYSVMYINPRTGKNYTGWIKSDRLQWLGTIRPQY